MWISRRVAEIVGALAAEKALTGELRAQLALERSRFNWIAQHMNELKLERAELYRRIGLYVPTPQIARVDEPLPGADDNYAVPTRGAVPDIGDLLAQARDIKDRTAETRLSAIAAGAAASIGSDIFDDIGDEAAGALGVAHETDGSIKVTR